MSVPCLHPAHLHPPDWPSVALSSLLPKLRLRQNSKTLSLDEVSFPPHAPVPPALTFSPQLHPLRDLTPSSTPVMKRTNPAAQSMSSPGGQSHLRADIFNKKVIRSNFILMMAPSRVWVFTANAVLFVIPVNTRSLPHPEMRLPVTGEKAETQQQEDTYPHSGEIAELACNEHNTNTGSDTHPLTFPGHPKSSSLVARDGPSAESGPGESPSQTRGNPVPSPAAISSETLQSGSAQGTWGLRGSRVDWSSELQWSHTHTHTHTLSHTHTHTHTHTLTHTYSHTHTH